MNDLRDRPIEKFIDRVIPYVLVAWFAAGSLLAVSAAIYGLVQVLT